MKAAADANLGEGLDGGHGNQKQTGCKSNVGRDRTGQDGGWGWGQEENVGGRAGEEHRVAEGNWQANKGGGRTGRGSPSGAI